MGEPDPNEPPVGSLAWWDERAERLRRRRPRVDGLTIERIVATAVDLVDRHGLDTLTMRRLADELSTASASLYRHVASRDELVVLVIDAVIGEVELPSEHVEGREGVEHLAHELRRVLLAHPHLLGALSDFPLVGPNARRGTERALDRLLAAGHRPEVAVPAYLALIDYVLGSVSFDAGARSGSVGSLDAPSSDQVFAFGLSTFLDGLDRPSADGTREQRSH